MGFLDKFRFWGRNPLTIVEMIIGITSVVGGLYVLSPLLVYSTAINGAGPIVALIAHPIGIMIFGLIIVISGLMMVIGVWKRKYKIRSWGLFVNILARTYALIGGFLISGFLPLTWMSSFVVLLITILCYIVVRGFLIRGEV
jgi:hypothetical protein